MVEEYEKHKRRQITRMRTITDYAMGVIFSLLGIYLLVYRHLGMTFMGQKPSGWDYLSGTLFLAYGAWRIYRGYKKNYFRDER